jgi:DNA transformation protein
MASAAPLVDRAGVHMLRNLGPRSAAMLADAGIETVGDLRAIGAAGAFRRLRFMGGNPSRNLLWSMAAGLQGRDWRSLDEDEKAALEAALLD